MSPADWTLPQGDARRYPGAHLRLRPTLKWSDSGGDHKVAVAERMVIGSTPDVNLFVADPTVSRLHAELDPTEAGLWIRDLGSRNGTFVEEVRVTGACLPAGGRLRVGDTVLQVEYGTASVEVEQWPEQKFGPLIGASRPMRELFARIGRVVRSESTVLVQGESGTGKELVARAIHEASPRAGGPLVVVDCGALPEALLESELFGHSRGAFTGAAEARAGAIEGANGGTVFLDEIGELPLAMQPKLLRVLEARAVRRLGETQHRPVDVRFISATHRDLREMVNSGAFREDLYFRLAVLTLRIPPLRERPDDIPPLLDRFLPAEVRDRLDPLVMAEILGRPWLGNVRELRNFAERLITFGAGDALAMDAPGARTTPASTGPYREARERALDDFERAYVRDLLARHGGNVSAAAQTAEMNRAYLYRLIARHNG
ncbi:MAG: two-component system, NtrC family, response regulator GlrR [Myxococcales bacterium]|nr:two-component system, NtrC family, response regulator GlrR [Myxococcales bacterium]